MILSFSVQIYANSQRLKQSHELDRGTTQTPSHRAEGYSAEFYLLTTILYNLFDRIGNPFTPLTLCIPSIYTGDRLFFCLFFHCFCLQWQPLQFSVLVILAASTGFCCLQGFLVCWRQCFMPRLHISLKRSQGRPLSLAPAVASSP